MTQEQIDDLQIGDWLVLANPKTTAAKAQRERIVDIQEECGIRIATVRYYSGNVFLNENRCEMNLNLFGGMENDPRRTD